MMIRALLTFGFLIPLSALAGAPKSAGQTTLKIICDDPSNLKNAKPAYKNSLEEQLKQLGASEVVCSSCHRSPERQRQICMGICGAERCDPPRACAKPGRSQHQRKQIAVCDLRGIPGSVQQTCGALLQLCRSKYQGKCGIGRYPNGRFHFGVNDDHFSAWSHCGFLSTANGQASRQMERHRSQRRRIMHR